MEQRPAARCVRWAGVHKAASGSVPLAKETLSLGRSLNSIKKNSVAGLGDRRTLAAASEDLRILFSMLALESSSTSMETGASSLAK